MIKAFNELLPFWQRGSSVLAVVSPEGIHLFSQHRDGGGSASALSLRRSSRSGSVMRFLSARVWSCSVLNCALADSAR